MPVVETNKKCAVSLKLNGGTRPETGSMILKTSSLGAVVKSGADAGKIMTIVNMIAPVLCFPLVSTERTTVSVIEN